ncbi:MAG TPA: FlgD immunoglobulin-like domain containing protein, partial [Candidatus Limnocylindrales bacterium]|nr:FlgD immunoglobulin-like domain containing protein [Candidatus Limnocylindrales bacterium]
TASVLALWSEYLDLPRYSGYVQFAEYRCHKDGSWSNWRNTEGGGTRSVEGGQAWGLAGSELAEATQADSVQLRYSIRCVPEISGDLHNCADLPYGVLYDNLRLQITTGVSAPIFGVYPAFVAQSTFVDGTIGGLGCNAGTAAAGQCWPGVRGSDISGSPEALRSAVHDNFNSPLGDSVALSITTGLRKNGKGINWHRGFDKAVNFGLTITHTNPNFVAAFDAPRIIYRLFDPASKTWSPFDSSELDANGVSINAGDTVLIDSRYRMNWPPRDRIGQALPGGFSINGKTLYSQLAFLPRGTRVQYYWKGVDINGGRSYQFSSDALAREVEDLPTLPGGSTVAPDIIEFDVLPRAYPPGPVGTLLAGRTNTPILNLDGAYTAWNYRVDPVTQALRALGVRADRYRLLQGTEQGANVGGHEFAGTRPGRLANYFPNMDEYAIKDSLAAWYRIMIESTHTRGSFSVVEEADAKLLKQWWEAPTGTDGGDRCIFGSGDDHFTSLLAVSVVPQPNENALATAVFGVAAVANQWNGGNSIPFPQIKDLFADPAAGPALGTGTYAYIVDGGCPGPNRFDALTKGGAVEIQNSATYPTFGGVTNTAAVSRMVEQEDGVITPDHDRNKALGYGYSIQFIRQGGMNLADTRAQILYKFLTSCRGPRGGADTLSCWPCPTDPNKYSNWLTSGGFQTGTYGPLYAIQDATRVLTAVEITPPPSFVDALLQNRPNPFNPETMIPYSLATPGRVSVRIYDVGGRLVRTVVDAIQPAGIHAARWNGVVESGKRSASGIYFYVITYPDGHKSSKKMTILR